MNKCFRIALTAVLVLGLSIDSAMAGWLLRRACQPQCPPASCEPVCCEPVCCQPVTCDAPCGGEPAPCETSCGGCTGTAVTSTTGPHATVVQTPDLSSTPTPAPPLNEGSGSRAIEPMTAIEPAEMPAMDEPMTPSVPLMETEPPAELPPAPMPGMTGDEAMDDGGMGFDMPMEEPPAMEPEPALDLPQPAIEQPVNPPTEDGGFGDFGEPAFDEPAPMEDDLDADPGDDSGFEELFEEEEPISEPATPAEAPADEDMPADDGGLFDGMEDSPEEDSDDGFGGMFGDEPEADDMEEQSSSEPIPAEDDSADDDGFGGLFGNEQVDEGSEEGGLFDEPESDDDAMDEEPAMDDEDDFGDIFGDAQRVLELPGGMQSEQLRTWTDNTGRFSCQGRLLWMAHSEVRLLKANGRTSTFPLRRLSAADLEFVTAQASAMQMDAATQTAQR